MQVKLTRHVAKESFPLRCGFEAQSDSMFELSDYAKVRGGKGGCTNYIADVSVPHTDEIFRMTCVVDSIGKLVTVFCADNKTENGLSDLTKDFSVERLISLHPFYKDGLIINFKTLISKAEELIRADGHAEGKAEAEKDITEAVDRANVFMKWGTELEVKNDGLQSENDGLKIELDRIQKSNAEIAVVESKTKPQGRAWTESAFSTPVVLEKVRVTKDNTSGQMTLILELKDNPPRQTRWDQDTIIQRAQAYRVLEGRTIQTTVSNRVDTDYPGSKFFNSVREAE